MSDIDDAIPDAKPEDGCEEEACDEDSDSLESDVSKLSNNGWKDDLALVVEDKQLYTNRSILAYASPVFDAMFSGEYKEKYVNEMPLPGKKFEDVVEFLRCITPSMMRPITMNNIFKVLPLAHEYQVVYLESACEVCFVHHLAENLKSVQVYEIMKNAVSYRLNKTKEKCIDIIAERPREEFEAKLGSMFPEDALNEIKAEMLRKLQTKYKDVFSHVQTSRALYQFLGLEAKQCDLVERYTEGRMLGDCANLKVSSSLKASTDMIIDERKIHIDIDKANKNYSSECVSINFESNEAPIMCVVAIYILNWMKGKDNKGHIEKKKLGRCYPVTISIKDWNTSLLRNEEAGFICKGTFEFRIYLFCLK